MGKATVRVKLASMTPKDISAGLLQLAARIKEEGVAPLLGGYFGNELVLGFSVATPKKSVSEVAFFTTLVEQRMTEVVPALRELLGAYLASFVGDEGTQPWYDPDTGDAGMALAMQALLLLDRKSGDVFRAFLYNVDGEHERSTLESIFPAYLEAYGYETADDLRIGICVLLRAVTSYAWDDPWNDNELLSSARSIVSGADFAKIIMEEIDLYAAARLARASEAEREEFAAQSQDGEGLSDLLRPLFEAEPSTTTFGRQLRAALKARWPDLET